MKTAKISLLIALCLFNIYASGQEGGIRKWYVPDGGVMYYAGGFGMFSAGPLYNPAAGWETGVTLGYVPPFYGNIWTVNLMGSYTFLKWNCTPALTFNFFKTGGFINFNFGKNIHLKWPDYYPSRYYWWNSSMRVGPFIENELKMKPASGQFDYVLSFHCNTNDLYFASYVSNFHSIHIQDILVFGIGIKLLLKE